MSEYVVKWRHWRCAHEFDVLVKCAKEGSMSPHYAVRDMATWFQPSIVNRPAGHGGKTECRILKWMGVDDDGRVHYMELAMGTAVCSWRDQFDRRVGRLYSLALALCELSNITYQEIGHLLLTCFPGISDEQLISLTIFIGAGDTAHAKDICSLIVAEWRKPKRKEHPQDDN